LLSWDRALFTMRIYKKRIKAVHSPVRRVLFTGSLFHSLGVEVRNTTNQSCDERVEPFTEGSFNLHCWI
jgi:hypothetical protein